MLMISIGATFVGQVFANGVLAVVVVVAASLRHRAEGDLYLPMVPTIVLAVAVAALLLAQTLGPAHA